MDHKVWKFEVNGDSHIVQLDWTYWAGRRDVLVDGKPRHESVIPMRWKSSQAFEIDGSHCVVTTEPHGTLSPMFRISLRVDGELIEPESGSSFWEGKDKTKSAAAD